jgi:hypothetical protein
VELNELKKAVHEIDESICPMITNKFDFIGGAGGVQKHINAEKGKAHEIFILGGARDNRFTRYTKTDSNIRKSIEFDFRGSADYSHKTIKSMDLDFVNFTKDGKAICIDLKDGQVQVKTYGDIHSQKTIKPTEPEYNSALGFFLNQTEQIKTESAQMNAGHYGPKKFSSIACAKLKGVLKFIREQGTDS